MNKKLLSPYIKRKVLSLKKLKGSNPALFKYIKDNYISIENRFGIKVLDDTVAIRGLDNIRSYLLYYYGKTVNLTKLRKNNIVLYNKLAILGNPKETIKEMGLEVSYEYYMTENQLAKELGKMANEKGIIKVLTKKLENKILYEARRANKTMKEYVHGLGYVLDYGGRLIDRKDTNDKS